MVQVPFVRLSVALRGPAVCALCIFLPGCLAASSSSSYETGRQVTSATLDKIKIGHTTDNWIIGALGEPTSRTLVTAPPEAETAEGEAKTEAAGGDAMADSASDPGTDMTEPAEDAAAETEVAHVDAPPPGTRSAERTGVPRVEILRYDWSRREESGGAFFLIFSGSKTSTERSSAWFEITDGIVTDYGVE